MSLKSDEKLSAQNVDKLITDAENTLIKEYEASLKTIKIRLSEIYEKYADNGSLSLSEMSKYNRMTALTDFLNYELSELSKKQSAIVEKMVSDIYSESYYGTGYSVVNNTGVDINYGVVNRDSVLALIKEPTVSGLSLSEILTKSRYDLLLKQRAAITKGFIQGDSYTAIAKSLTETFEISMNKALLIARTEGTRSQGQGQTDGYTKAKETGINVVRVWMTAAGAKHPRHNGTSLDGQKEDENGMFHYNGYSAVAPGQFGVAKEDCNCRCTLRGEIDELPPDETIIPEEDRPTYEDWLKAQKSKKGKPKK